MVQTVALVSLAWATVQVVVAQDNVYAREVWRRRYNAGKRAIFGGAHNNGGHARLLKRQLDTRATSESASTSTATVAASVSGGSAADASLSPTSTGSPFESSVGSSSTTLSTTQTPAPSVSAYTGVSSRALAASSSSTCAPAYTSGATTISGTGTLPTPSAFVTKLARTQQLTVSGQPFKIVGPSQSLW